MFYRIAGHPLAQNERCLHMFLQEPVIDKNYVPGKIRPNWIVILYQRVTHSFFSIACFFFPPFSVGFIKFIVKATVVSLPVSNLSNKMRSVFLLLHLLITPCKWHYLIWFRNHFGTQDIIIQLERFFPYLLWLMVT